MPGGCEREFSFGLMTARMRRTASRMRDSPSCRRPSAAIATTSSLADPCDRLRIVRAHLRAGRSPLDCRKDAARFVRLFLLRIKSEHSLQGRPRRRLVSVLQVGETETVTN